MSLVRVTLVSLACVGIAVTVQAQTVFYTADFEDGEVNPGILEGVVNTDPYPATQPWAFGQVDAYGWQNRGHNYLTGDTTLLDVASYTGQNCASVINRFLRSDIEHTLQANSLYKFTFWYMVPSGMNLTFINKVVIKDQTNGYLFIDTGNDDVITAAAHDTWYSRTVTIDTTGYGPADAGDTVDLRFGAVFSGDEGDGALTDNWSVSYEPAPEGFVDVTSDVGLDAYVPAGVDASANWADYDNDGWPDLFLASYDATGGGVFRNNAGTSFTQYSDIGGLASHPGLFVDFDNDGDKDIITAMAGGHFSINNGNNTWIWNPWSWLADVLDVQAEWHAFADFDNDGYLDAYRAGWVATGLPTPDDGIFINDNGSYFNLIWQGPAGDERNGRAVTCADYDEDGDIDVYVSNYAQQANFLWVNQGDTTFVDMAPTFGIEGYGNTIGSSWGDLDNDGHLDLVVINLAHPGQQEPLFFRNTGPPNWDFQDMTGTVGLPYVESHASPTLGDIDNDGDLDVFITAVGGAYPGDESTLMRNDGGWNFTDVSDAYGLRITTPYTNFMGAWADYDDDGDLDLMTGRKLYRNYPYVADSGNHWLKVKVVGNLARSVNRDAIGTQVRIDLTADGLGILTRQVENATGWGNQNQPTLHFGLADVAGPVDLEVFWPNGETQVVEGVEVDQTVTVGFPPPTGGARDDMVLFRAGAGEALWYGAHTQPDPTFFDDPDGAGGTEEMTITTAAGPFGPSSGIPLLGDVDGDGMDDIVVVHNDDNPISRSWDAAHTVDTDVDGIGELSTTSSSSLAPFGLNTDPVFLADVTGDGADDAITVNPGFNWYCQPSTPGVGLDTTAPQQGPVQWGLAGDTPHVGDFNGDTYADICVYRPSGHWYVHLSNASGIGSGTTTSGQFGTADYDVSLVGDIDGDGRTDAVLVDTDNASGLMQWIAVYADASGTIDFSNFHSSFVYFGLHGDTPFLSDVNGDGQKDIGVIRHNPATGHMQWFVGFTSFFGDLYGGGAGDDSGDFGVSGIELPVIGNLDTDNDQDDIVLYHRAQNDWLGSHTAPAPDYLTGVQDMGTLAFGPPTDLAPMLGDVDGDGADDLVVRYDLGDQRTWSAAHSVIAGGEADFSSGTQSSLGDFGYDALAQFLADVDADGAADAISVDSDYYWEAALSVPGVGLDDTLIDGPVQYGIVDDVPIVGDFNGDTYTDIGVFRPSGGNWYVNLTGPGGLGDLGEAPAGQFGGATWEVVLIGDINGDGRDDGVLVDIDNGSGLLQWVASYADVNGTIDFFGSGHSNFVNFGLDTDTPTLADFNGDGMDDIVVFRPSTAQWFTTWTTGSGELGTNPAGDDVQLFGQVGDIPLVGDFGDAGLIGDLNCDGAVNGFDIDPFVLAVGGDLGEYYALYPDCDHTLADINEDGSVDGFDIDPFVVLVGGG